MPAARPQKNTKTKTKSSPSYSFLSHPDVLKTAAPKGARKVAIHVVKSDEFSSWSKKQPKALLGLLNAQGWSATAGSVAPVIDTDGSLAEVYVGSGIVFSLYTFAQVVDTLQKSVPSNILQDLAFEIATPLNSRDLKLACTGWALACHQFDAYKASKKVAPLLVMPKDADKVRIEAQIQAATLARNLVNLPANAMGPEELADAAKTIATAKQATIKIIADKDLLTKNFPLVYGVGDSSLRRPRVIDITWGKPTDPKVTLVGKGVCFDTGGLDIKPSAGMLNMKKDMGGAAMVLAVLWLVASLKLPIRLRVIIPAVENSVSPQAFRPMDILPSRKGLSVEIGNTDAEGRLILADCLTWACEEKPDLLIDFATLTGHIRTALGMDIPAIFSNNDAIAQQLQGIAMSTEDPMWQMPLYQPYKPDIMSPVADINNAGNNQAGGITAALFLESFIEKTTNWIHLDLSAWEVAGRPGRPRGGTDMGVRAVLELLEQRYAKKKK